MSVPFVVRKDSVRRRSLDRQGHRLKYRRVSRAGTGSGSGANGGAAMTGERSAGAGRTESIPGVCNLLESLIDWRGPERFSSFWPLVRFFEMAATPIAAGLDFALCRAITLLP
jgi:hypothetical protein